MTLVDVALVPLEGALAVHLVVLPVAFVARPVRPCLDAESFFLVALEHAVIDISFGSGVDSSAFLVTVGPFSLG